MSLGPSIMKILFRPFKTAQHLKNLTADQDKSQNLQSSAADLNKSQNLQNLTADQDKSQNLQNLAADPDKSQNLQNLTADQDKSGTQASDCNLVSRISARLSRCFEKHPKLEWYLDLTSAVLQALVTIVFIVVSAIQGNVHVIWSVPVSLLLTAGHHWENYADAKPSFSFSCLSYVTKRIKKARRSRVMIHFVASVCKIVVTLLMMFITVGMHIDFIGGPDPYVAAFNLNR